MSGRQKDRDRHRFKVDRKTGTDTDFRKTYRHGQTQIVRKTERR